MLVSAGHEVMVEKGAGVGSGFPDEQYVTAGARIVPNPDDAWSADMVIGSFEDKVNQSACMSRPYIYGTMNYCHLKERIVIETRQRAFSKDYRAKEDGR